MIEAEWLSVKNGRLLSVEDEWEKFKCFILSSAEELCGYYRIGRGGKKVNGGIMK